MRLTAADLTTFYRPSKCDLRVFLKSRREREEPPSAYEEVLFRLGERHERQHLASLTSVTDLSQIPIEERLAHTQQAMAAGASVIYQGALRAEANLSGAAHEIIGVPDFMMLEKSGYLIRDSKIARRITEEDHPEIIRQLGIYGWLYERSTRRPPAGLQIHSGTGTIVDVPYDRGLSALNMLERIVSAIESRSMPYDPVGWTKCSSCCFRGLCLQSAEQKRDVALVEGVDQGLAMALRQHGTETVDQLLANFNDSTLAEFQRPWGKGTQRVGKRASSILLMARAMATGQEILIGKPTLPRSPNYVMFDLEGLPPQLDELDKIYLWGTQVFGDDPGVFLPAVASFGADGDQEGWEAFLANASSIFDKYSDLPFVHWHHYERTKLDAYVKRHGDPNGTAARVRANLLDLLPLARDAVALPLPSYSLKVVEKYIGFKRSLEEYGGDWAMAQYIEAVETEDESKRQAIMDKILTYNKEDLEATWAVFKWLVAKAV
ncbi:MAG: TM0106 family RecB-like putative nuclease [Syntrophorhabdales bacterium]|jgi:predicted RecB family nuclease